MAWNGLIAFFFQFSSTLVKSLFLKGRPGIGPCVHSKLIFSKNFLISDRQLVRQIIHSVKVKNNQNILWLVVNYMSIMDFKSGETCFNLCRRKQTNKQANNLSWQTSNLTETKFQFINLFINQKALIYHFFPLLPLNVNSNKLPHGLQIAGLLTNLCHWSLSIPSENIRKPSEKQKNIWCFQRV